MSTPPVAPPLARSRRTGRPRRRRRSTSPTPRAPDRRGAHPRSATAREPWRCAPSRTPTGGDLDVGRHCVQHLLDPGLVGRSGHVRTP
ncbi:hypothetical protein FVA95_28415 [Pseudonocardia sp. EV170527-09]|nr:hypothetical protein FVA95_28415 [Pseudonocardia sp. EV170527-09]